jgi:hypothetical protein
MGGIGQRGGPVIAVHKSGGRFCYAEIATIGGNPAIGVARSTDDCQSFGAAVDVGPAASSAGDNRELSAWPARPRRLVRA